jgi:hypothetical protein
MIDDRQIAALKRVTEALRPLFADPHLTGEDLIIAVGAIFRYVTPAAEVVSMEETISFDDAADIVAQEVLYHTSEDKYPGPVVKANWQRLYDVVRRKL